MVDLIIFLSVLSFVAFCTFLSILLMNTSHDYTYHKVATRRECEFEDFELVFFPSVDEFFEVFDTIEWIRDTTFPGSLFVKEKYMDVNDYNLDSKKFGTKLGEYFTHYKANRIHAGVYIMGGKGYIFNSYFKFIKMQKGILKRLSKFPFKKE